MNDGWRISDDLIAKIQELLPKGTILELGSGTGSTMLVDLGYTVSSIEHDISWLHRDSRVNYIHAPLVDGWYDTKELLRTLPNLSYDLILVDGPPGNPPDARMGFFFNLHLFNFDLPMIFDDVNRREEMKLAKLVAVELSRDLHVHDGKEKSFAWM